MFISTLFYLLIFIQFSDQLNNDLGKTSQMGTIEQKFCIYIYIKLYIGWNSWNHFGCHINEITVRQIADAMVATDLAAVGYEYDLFFF
jgi:hypothetical protein